MIRKLDYEVNKTLFKKIYVGDITYFRAYTMLDYR